jgi:ubiquinone/menaquinone biosynthesis C-methylase UbiE
MNPVESSEREDAELQRIRAEYQARSRRVPADFYALWREENFYMHAQIARTCLRLLRDNGLFPIDGAHIADIGCGDGRWLLAFLQWGAVGNHLHGIDLLPDRIAAARQRAGNTNLVLGNAVRLPWRNHSFDLVTQFVVLSSVSDIVVRQRIAAEMMRVIRPGGHILWFDTQRDNPLNPALHGIKRRDLEALFPGCRIQAKRTVLIPAIARAVARRSWSLALALEKIPLARTHLVALITPEK